MRALLIACSILFSVVAHNASRAEVPTDVLHAQAEILKSTLEPGDQAEIRIRLDLAANHHAYQDRFKLKVIDPDFFAVHLTDITPTVEFFDKPSKSVKRGVSGQSQVTAILEVSEKAPPGDVDAKLGLTYQACTDEYCLLPQTIPVNLHFKVATPHANLKAYTPEPSEFSEVLSHGAWYTFAFVFFMGVLTSFTPCIYPMIPITLAIIGSRSQDSGRGRGFVLSVFYVLGLALTYALIGVIVARTGALFGSVMSSPWVVGTIAFVFAVMGLSMYGFFEIQAPAFLRDRLGSAKTQTGFTGAFASGLIAGIVASPCVGPVLVSILAYIAQTQSSLLGFTLLFTFALGMGILLIVVGTFSQTLQYLPRSGGWMEAVKFIFGTLMFGVAHYYLAQAAPMGVVYLSAGLSCVFVASQYGAFTPDRDLTSLTRLAKGLMIVVLLLGFAFVLKAVDTVIPILPQSSLEQSQGLQWEAYTDEALMRAKAEKRPVILDFSAEWCAACHELDNDTYTDAGVKDFAKQFTLLKVDATEETPEITKLAKRYRVLGLPTVLFIDRSGKVLNHLTLTGFEKPEQFLERMKRAL